MKVSTSYALYHVRRWEYSVNGPIFGDSWSIWGSKAGRHGTLDGRKMRQPIRKDLTDLTTKWWFVKQGLQINLYFCLTCCHHIFPIRAYSNSIFIEYGSYFWTPENLESPCLQVRHSHVLVPRLHAFVPVFLDYCEYLREEAVFVLFLYCWCLR